MSVVHVPHWQGKAQVSNPVLETGVLGIDTTNGAIKVGDGTTAFNSLAAINAPAGASAPASATAAGHVGQIAFDATHIYVCIASNVWVRATLATW